MQTQKNQIERGTFDQCKHRMDSSCHSADVTKKTKITRVKKDVSHVHACACFGVNHSLMPPANSLSKLRRDCTPVADLVVFFTPGAAKHP